MFRRQTLGRIPFGHTLFLADDGASTAGGSNAGGNNAGNNNGAQTQNDTPTNQSQNNQGDSVQALLNAIKNSQRVGGDVDKASEVLAGQVLAKDARIKELEGKTIKESERQLLTAIQKLLQDNGLKTVEEIQEKLQRLGTLETEVATNAKKEQLRAATGASGVDPDKLMALSGALDDEYFTKTEKGADGKDVVVGYVKFKNEAGAEETKTLSERIAQRWPAMQDALRAGPVAPTVAGYPRSAPKGSGSQASVFERTRAEMEEKNKKAAAGPGTSVASRINGATPQ